MIPSENSRWCCRCGREFDRLDLPVGTDDSPATCDEDGEIVDNPAHVCLSCREGGDDEG